MVRLRHRPTRSAPAASGTSSRCRSRATSSTGSSPGTRSRHALPTWADHGATGPSMWAPDVHYAGHGQWRMYYVVTETTGTGWRPTEEVNDNAIGMATAPRRSAPGRTAAARWSARAGRARTTTSGRSTPRSCGTPTARSTSSTARTTAGSSSSRWPPTASGLTGRQPASPSTTSSRARTSPARTATGTSSASTANCCAGPTTGYSVEVARSRSLTGPYVDKDGLRIDVGGDTGGTPVLYQNGNRWIGTGHNSMATDDRGQRWIVYHAIDRNNPFLNEPVRDQPAADADRPDRLGARLARGPVRLRPQRVRAARARRQDLRARSPPDAGSVTARTASRRSRPSVRAASTGPASDEFNGSTLAPAGSRCARRTSRCPAARCNWPTERPTSSAPRTRRASCCATRPTGYWTVADQADLDLGHRRHPQLPAGRAHRLRQRRPLRPARPGRDLEHPADRVRQGDAVRRNGLSYGGTIVGPPAPTTWLRVVHQDEPENGEHVLTPFTSRDGHTWTRGGSWTLPARQRAQGRSHLQGAGGAGRDRPPTTASFDYFHVYRP